MKLVLLLAVTSLVASQSSKRCDYRCKDGVTCIKYRERCNMIPNCPDQDDEFGCPENSYSCPDGEFTCSDGTCIDNDFRCDSIPDCPDKSDEIDCKAVACKRNESQCRDGRGCYDPRQHCDGRNDCADGSDEINCGMNCGYGETKCRDNRNCYTSQERCDGHQKCYHGDDEENCPDDDKDETPNVLCRPNEFECGDGECISLQFRCDTVKDCSDNSDEMNCTSICGPNDHTCGDGECIKESRICDGVSDCYDKSDENNCPDECSWSQFRCDSGDCIPFSQNCDGHYDCDDRSDERDCPTSPMRCENWQTACKSGDQCISSSLACDGTPDCSDGSDEDDCPSSGSSVVCGAGEVRCLSGNECIPRNQSCDGTYNCRDRSDEDNCASPPVLQLKTYPPEQTIKESREVVFQCRDEGQGHIPVRWSRGDGLPLPPNSRDIRGRLEMPNIQTHHEGTYYCEAVGVPLNSPGARVTVYLKVEPFVAPTSIIPVCGPDQATCHNRQCIPRSFVCNGNIDCSDGSDESRCSPHGCEPNEFRCDNKKCVRLSWVCDHDDDCGDGSDERECWKRPPGSMCFTNEFKCARENQCIPKWFHCDDHNDCQDSSDEIGCYPMKIVEPPRSVVILEPGQTLVLNCRAEGVPTPIIAWRLNWHHIPAKCRTNTTNGYGTLTCPNMQEFDQGAYTCEALDYRHSILSQDTHVSVRPVDTQCPQGTFNDLALNTDECINCFCCGHTTDCHSANYTAQQVRPPSQSVKFVSVYINPSHTSVDIRLNENAGLQNFPRMYQDNGFQISSKLNRGYGNVYPYYLLTNEDQQNYLKSYGGYLHYRVNFANVAGQDLAIPDIIIVGNNKTLTYKLPERIVPGRDNDVRARIWPEEWRVLLNGRSSYASRQDIMQVLVSVDQILIRVAYLSGASIDTTISDVKLDSATTRGSGSRAPFVEQCRCPSGYEGDSCQRCSDGYVRVDTGGLCSRCVLYTPEPCPPGTYQDYSGRCLTCPCPLTSPSNQFSSSCVLGSDGQVTCQCPAAYSGKRCEQCSPGYVGNPLEPGGRCVPRGECDEAGALSSYPDPSTGKCECKAHVTGERCDRCAGNSFALAAKHQHGCINCFCMAVTDVCTSSNLFRDEVRTQFTTGPMDFGIAPVDDLLDVQNVSFNQNAREITFSSFYPKVYYWVLPAKFLGDKVTSYGGYLRYTLRYVPVPGGQSSRNNEPDVELRSLNNIVLVHRQKDQLSPGVDMEVSVPILEQHWTREDGGTVEREHLLMALADLSGIYIKATYTTNTRQASLKRVSMDIASETGRSTIRAVEVEQCRCPAGYRGTSCEDCDAGYTRTDDGLYLKLCEPCNCNNHSNTCHPETGECEDCADNTMGPRCEDCLPGFERESDGRCYRSGEICDCDPRGISGPCYGVSCQCKVNVIGERCDQCRSGTFGLSATRPEGCMECYCSGLTSQCQQSNLYREEIPTLVLDDNHGFTLHYSSPYSTPTGDRNVIKDGFVTNFAMAEVGYTLPRKSPQRYFWSLPSALTGNRVTSYGGDLRFKLRYTGPTRIDLVPDTSIILNGNGLSIYREFDPSYMDPDYPKEFRVPLIDDGRWKLMKPTTSRVEVSRFDMLKVLSNLESILVLASLDNTIETTHISDVAMDTAVPSRRGKEATEVEVCRCPPEYKGSSCESCNDHYYRHYDQTCRSCPCNNNEESCSLGPNNQVRCNCRPGYYGTYCENRGSPPDLPPVPPVEPKISVVINTPTIGIVEVGSTIVYNCSAFSNKIQKRVDVHWMKEGGPLPSRAIQNRGVLTLRDVREDDSGNYVCTARDGYSSQTETVALSVGGISDSPPSITIVPSDQIEIREGERIEIRCIAAGSPRPNVAWQRVDNKPFSSQIQQYDGVFRLSSARREDSGEYSCTARNRVGSETSYVTLFVRDRVGPSSIEAQPRMYTGVEGDTVTIICTSPRSYNRLVWSRRDGRTLPQNVRDYNGTLTIYGARSSDSGVYICTAIDNTGRRVADTEATVEFGNYRTIGEAAITPNRQVVPQGEPAQMQCTSTDPNARFTWSKREGTIPPHIQLSRGLLKISAVRVTDRGMYICTMDSPSGSKTTVYANLEVDRREAPTIELYPRTQHTMNLGSSTLLQCRVMTGIPTPVVYWTRANNASMPLNVQQSPNGVLRLNNVRASDGGEYECHAENEAGSTMATARIVVQSPPVARIIPSSTIQLNAGDPLKLECSATGYPTPTVLWSRHHASSRLLGLGGGITEPSYSKALYEAHSVTAEDEGLYLCIARNDAGTVEERIEVFVNDDRRPPQTDDDNEILNRDTFLAYGESGSLNCKVRPEVSGKRYRLEWARGDRRQSLPDGSHQRNGVLYLENVDETAEGEYVCIMIDEETGSILQQSPTRVIINYPPRITLKPRRQTVKPLDDARIDCEVDGEQPITIRWEAMDRTMPSSVHTQDGILLFQQIAESDAGSYVCIATNRYGEAKSLAEVFVRMQDTHHRPIVRALDNRVEASEGSTATLHCLADITAQMEWRRESDDRDLPANAIIQGNMLRLESVTPDDSGRYTCTVLSPLGHSGTDFIDLSVIRTHSVKLTISPSIDIIKVGNTVDLRCLGSGVSPSQLSWTKLGERLASNVHVMQNVLRISDVTTKNAGIYRCSYRSPAGQVYEEDYILKVQGNEPFWPGDDPEALEVKTVDMGQTVTLPCVSNLEPPVKYSWTKQGGPLPSNAIPNQNELTISNIRGEDAGMYICSMANGEVRMEKQIMITVTGLIPSFSQNPISYITMPMLLDSSIQFDLELLFKPEQPDGLMLYNGQYINGSGDFISVGLRNGRPEFKFNVGSGAAEITGRPVSMGEWHRVRVSRNKKLGEMWINGEGPYRGESLGKHQSLDLDLPLYLGAVPDFDSISKSADYNQGFIGCISEFKVGSVIKPITRQNALGWEGVGDCDTCRGHLCTNSAACQQSSNSRGYICLCPRGFSDENCSKLGESCYEGICGLGKCEEADRGIRCKCPIDKAGDRCERHVTIRTPQFNGNSYITYPLTKSSSRLKMTLKFNPAEDTDGILFFMNQPGSNHYAALTIRQRHLEFSIDQGQGLSRVESQLEVRPGEWETATIGVDHRGAYIQYRNVNQYDPSVKLNGVRIHAGSVLHLGGVDSTVRVPHSLSVYGGFQGCISSIDVYGQNLNIISSSDDAVDITECQTKESSCRTNPCRNGGSCSIYDNTQKCSCPPGYGGNYCEDVMNACKVNDDVCQNRGMCTPLAGGKYKCTCYTGTAGKNCEEVLETDVSLSGDGYVELDSELMDHTDSSRAHVIELEITTTSADGLLLYQGQSADIPLSGQTEDFLAIAVVNGEIEVRFDLGSGEASISAPLRVDDGVKHSIVVNRTASDATISVDDGASSASGSSQGYLSQLNAQSNIYIGGIPDIQQATRGRYRHGFSGCIHRLKLPEKPDIDFGQEARETVNALPCSKDYNEDYPAPSFRGDGAY